MKSLKVSVASSPVSMVMMVMVLMALLPFFAWSAPAPTPVSDKTNPNVVYERYVRRRPQLNQYNQEIFEVREIYYKPTPKIRLIDDDEMDSIIRCDFDATLSDCENLIRTSTSKSNVVPTTTTSTTTSTTTTTTTTTTNKPEVSIVTTDWPHLPELSEEEISAEDQEVKEIDDNTIDNDEDDNADDDGMGENEKKNPNKREENLINEDIIEENNIGDVLRPYTIPPELSDLEDVEDQDAIDNEDIIESNNVGNVDEKFGFNARVDGNGKNENDEDDDINDEIDNGIGVDYRSEEDGAMGYLDLTAQRK